MLAIAALMAWEVEDIRVVKIGETWTVGNYELNLRDVRSERGANYQATVADVALVQNRQTIAMMRPEKRFYPVAKMPTTEAGIDYRLFRDVYVVLGDAQENGGWTIRSYIKPFANWIWAGSILMALGGLLSLSDRRLRTAPTGHKSRPRQALRTAPAE